MRAWEPPGQEADDRVTDEELEQLAWRGLFEEDHDATERLVSLIRDRSWAPLRALYRCLPRVDREDAFQDFLVPVWSALRQVADGNVHHPWAYVSAAMTYSAWTTSRRWATRRAQEDQLVPAAIDQPGTDDVPLLLSEGELNEVLSGWEHTLTPKEREAWEVVRRQAEDGVSRNEAHRRMKHDETVQNRIDKRIARGRQPNGFLDRLRKLLVGEEGAL